MRPREDESVTLPEAETTENEDSCSVCGDGPCWFEDELEEPCDEDREICYSDEYDEDDVE